jgi:ketosteroid isomerase-like protein
MSQENVEVVRRAIDAYNRGDRVAMLKEVAPDFELDMSRSIGLQRGIWRLDQVMRFLDDLEEPFQSHRIEVEKFIDTGDQVIVQQTAHVRGRGGIEAKARTAVVYTVRNGAVARMCMYQDLPEALEAMGLSE